MFIDGKPLSEPHLADLRASGLTDETIQALGIYSEDNPDQLSLILKRRYAKSRGSALVFPFRDHEGNTNGYKRIKPSFPRQDRNGKPVKYESPRGEENRAYFPPDVLAHLQEPKTELLVVEGEKKAAAACQEGFPCIGLVGVYGWKFGKGVDRLVPDLDAVKWSGRRVVIVYDSDLADKPEIQEAESRLAQQLAARGAKVRVARLPDLPDGSKCGLDDFLVHHGNVELRKVLDKAEEPEPVKSDVKLPAAQLDSMPEARRFLQYIATGRTVPLVFYRDQFYGFDRCKYRELSDSEIKARVTEYLDRSFSYLSKSAVGNVIACLQSLTMIEHWHEMPRWLGKGDHNFIAMRNGLLDLDGLLAGRNDVLHKHTPMWFSTIALPYDFVPDADCLKWKAFLERNLEGDAERIEFLQEWFGYCLSHDTSQQRFLVFEGEGANGKSVACAVLTALLGEDNVSHVPLESFGQRFQLTSTLGKLANIAAEVGELDKAAEGFLKSFTSGDRMLFDRKHRDPINAMPSARLVLSTNNRPRFADRSGGLWRRMVLIPWTVTIPESERVPGMDKPEYWETELPGIFAWAVVGLHRLRRRGQFTIPQACKSAVDEYRTESNPARLFLKEQYKENSLAEVESIKVYAHYSKWCEESGYRPLANGSFGKEVKRVFPAVERKEKRDVAGKNYYYIGLTNQD